MVLFGLPLSSLSSAVLLGCFFSLSAFFIFFFFFGCSVCESVVDEAAGSEAVDSSARATDEPAAESAKAAISERVSFEGTGRLLEGRSRRIVRPLRSDEPGPPGIPPTLVWVRLAAGRPSGTVHALQIRALHFPCSADGLRGR